MTTHSLAMLAIDDSLKVARELVSHLEQALRSANRRDYTAARVSISNAVTDASYLDHHYLSNARQGLEACA